MQLSEYIDNFSKEMKKAYGFNLDKIRFNKEAAIANFLHESKTGYMFELEVSPDDNSNICPSINVLKNGYFCNITVDELKTSPNEQKAYILVIESKYCDGLTNKNYIRTTDQLLKFFNLCVAALSY